MLKINELFGYLFKILIKIYLFLFIASIAFTPIKCDPLPIASLKHYEIIHNIDIKHNKFITKRSAETKDNQNNEFFKHLVSFRAIDRDFNLLLTQNKDIISSQFNAFTIDSNGRKKPISVDLNDHYKGSVDGIDGSEVRAHIDPATGLMIASIHTGDETFEVEPIWRLSESHRNNFSSMIVFKHSDLKHSANGSTAESTPICDYIKIDDNITTEEFDTNERIRRKRDAFYNEIGIGIDINSDFKPSATHCSVILVADYFFYRDMGDSDIQTTTNYLVHIIDRVNNIFTQTEWSIDDSNPGFKGMGFFIKEIQIHEEFDEKENHYNSPSRRTVAQLLEIYSQTEENSQFCLAHLFTHRKFDNSVLGLAYVASPRVASVGGVCSPTYEKLGRKLYLNTGLTTTKNQFDKRIITREAVLVTAHEFGHNWGAEHDPDTSECSPPARIGGSYVMYTYSVTGYEKNNKFFSPCSRRSIRSVLMSKSHRCFLKPEKSYCGNSLVEEGEECDEGLLVRADHYQQGLCCDNRCRLIAGADCSDKNSECCGGCRIKERGVRCKERDDYNCKEESYCDGDSDKCPEPFPLNDTMPCLDRGQCFKGKCQSFCQTKNLWTCMCEEHNDACFRCCRAPYDNSTCLPYRPFDPLQDGTPCKYGFCEKNRCERSVQDPLERFWDIVEEININTFFTFMKDNIVFAVILISAIIWIPLSVIISNYDQKEKEELNRRSASLSSGGSGRRVTRNFSRKHTRPGMRTRRTGLRSEARTVSHETRSQSQQRVNPYANPMYESVL